MSEGLKLIGVGVVAADKPAVGRIIEVYPYEKIPFYEGSITDEVAIQEVTGEDASGQTYTVKLNRSMTVTAEWLGEDNRWTTPKVKKGEQVLLYTVGNTDIYYWKTIGRDQKLRRTESVVWGFVASSSADGDDVTLDQNNCYVVMVDTEKGHITLKTSKDRGEPTVYTIQLNTAEGLFIAMDDKGNIIRMNSVDTELALINADGTLIQLTEKRINVNADEKVYVTSELLHVIADVYVEGRAHFTGLVTSDTDFNALNVSLVEHPHTGNLGYTTSTPLPINPYEPMAVGG